jgi:hypothetical protein
MTGAGASSRKALDALSCRHERRGQVWEWDFADDHQESHLMPDNRPELVRLVPDPGVVTQSDPFTLADLRQPVLVGTVA